MKTFIGEVIESQSNEFADKDGEMVRTWKLSIALNEEKGLTFHVSEANPLWNEVQLLELGTTIKVECVPEVRANGFLKYKLVKVCGTAE